MSRPHQIAGIALIVGSGWAMRESLHLQYYSSLGPGPGFFPFWIALLLGVLGAVILCEATFRSVGPVAAGHFFPDRAGSIRIAAVIVVLCIPLFLLNPLGFRLTMFIFMVGVLLALGHRGMLTTTLLSMTGSFGLYHMFVHWLGIPLPLGRLGF